MKKRFKTLFFLCVFYVTHTTTYEQSTSDYIVIAKLNIPNYPPMSATSSLNVSECVVLELPLIFAVITIY
jgi:hypothetical protein